VLVAASLATTLHHHRRQRQRRRDSERALGRTIIAEVPSAADLVLFSEDRVRFYYGDRSIDKDLIVSVHVLINGSPIASAVSRDPRGGGRTASSRASGGPAQGAGAAPDHAGAAHGVVEADSDGGMARDRWDVLIETRSGTILVECGTIRERVSQELARTIFEAIRLEVEERNRLEGNA
jgi:hypothetical protein